VPPWKEKAVLRDNNLIGTIIFDFLLSRIIRSKIILPINFLKSRKRKRSGRERLKYTESLFVRMRSNQGLMKHTDTLQSCILAGKQWWQ
jgi:hypothetical protein